MTPPPPIPEEAVERLAREYFDHEIGGTPEQHKEGPDGWATDDWMEAIKDQIGFFLSRAGALYLTEEEKRALLGVTKTTTGFVSGRLGRNLTEEFRSARQKLEESLK